MVPNFRNGKIAKLWILALSSLIGLLFFSPAQGAGSLQVFQQESQDGSRKWVVQAQGVTLSRVLNAIAEKSGVRFDIPESLSGETVSLETQGLNWTDIVLEILQDHNTVYVWAEPFRLKQVHLLNDTGKPESILSVTAKPAVKRKKHRTKKYYKPKAHALPDSGLTQSQLKSLVTGKPGEPIPAALFKDFHIRRFLETNGMKSPRDRADRKLILKVRRQARRHLRMMTHLNQRTSR